MNLQNNPMQCGAKTRRGTPCPTPAMPNGRCRMHGGTSPGAPVGNDNAVKHGIYRARLTEEEQATYDQLEPGGVDEELRLTRTRLARALRAEQEGREPGRDYDAIVDRLLGRIERLELTRRRLLDATMDSDEVILIDPNPDIP